MNQKHTVIVDDFLEKPYAIRDIALGLEFKLSPAGIYSGKRTLSLNHTHTFLYDRIKKRVLNYYNLKPDDYEAEICFHTTEAVFGQLGWVHSDFPVELACVLYLNPNINHMISGTSFFDLKPNSKVDNNLVGNYMRTSFKISEDNQEMKDKFNSKFVKTATVGGKFNRLVIYPGNMFHAGEGYFGTEVSNSRLTLLGFFFKKNS
jgi:hypothetical protein